MPIIFENADALANELKIRFSGRAIIGVDGWTGVGKTTLGKSLAATLNGSFYDLDGALTHDQKQYVSALRLNEIEQALAEHRGLLFVSGICVRQVLAMVPRNADAHIYVKRMAAWGWVDEDELTGGSVPEFPGASGERMREELRLYHECWHPQAIADYEFRRVG